MAKFMDMAQKLLSILLILVVLIHELVDGKTIMKASNKTIVKTIKGDNDEIIDCYDIYKQPVFNDPLFHNHSIQIRPSSYPEGFLSNNLKTVNLTHSWHKYGICPEETIPIKRSGNSYNSMSMLPYKYYSDDGYVHRAKNQETTNSGEVAGIACFGDDFRGAQATINIWKPLTEDGELSASQIWVSSRDASEAIQAGWQVHPKMYGDNETRFYVAWRVDYYQTGCYDIRCKGFVQTSSTISLGASFETSIFNDTQYDAIFSIFQDQSTRNWWVTLQGVEVGYWPPFLFKQLSTKATRADFGGVIANTRNQGRHTSTDMGSGHLPSEGSIGVSSYFSQVKVIDGNHISKDPGTCSIIMTNPHCYGLKLDHKHLGGYGFFYGGPGFSYNCE
ncbi:hypothetical protein MKX03_003330 [Papaver bracteatum]|nr:hypothetical protein MKX03_003330 [Papaver bracteatum]